MKKELSVEEVAEVSGIPAEELIEIERGERTIDMFEVFNLSGILEFKLDDVFKEFMEEEAKEK